MVTKDAAYKRHHPFFILRVSYKLKAILLTGWLLIFFKIQLFILYHILF